MVKDGVSNGVFQHHYCLTLTAGNTMDLSYGSEYEDFREKARQFLKKNGHLAPKPGAAQGNRLTG